MLPKWIGAFLFHLEEEYRMYQMFAQEEPALVEVSACANPSTRTGNVFEVKEKDFLYRFHSRLNDFLTTEVHESDLLS